MRFCLLQAFLRKESHSFLMVIKGIRFSIGDERYPCLSNPCLCWLPLFQNITKIEKIFNNDEIFKSQ